MKIFGLGMPELIIILIVILLIFGPKNLPKLGNALGRTVKSLREGMGGKKKNAEADAEGATPDEVVIEDVKQTEPAPTSAAAAANEAASAASAQTSGEPKKKVVRRVVRKS